MDSLTHIALGACMGEAFAGQTVGRKAMLWGILAQSIPDIDFIASTWLDTTSNLLAHRGFTHSILFGVVVSLSWQYWQTDCIVHIIFHLTAGCFFQRSSIVSYFY